MQNIQTFLLLPTYNPVNDFFKNNHDLVLDESLLAEYLNQLELFLDIAFQEKATDVYYSHSNISQFLSGFEHFEDEYLSNPSGRLSDMLQNADDWEENPVQKNVNYYAVWMSQKMESIPIYESHTFTEIVERLSIHLNDKLLLIDHLATHNNKMYIDIIKGDHIDSDVPTVLRFDTVSEVKLLESWISKKRIPRVFNLNPKHGENGTHVIANKGEKVEMLRCSRHEATNLLTIAKGDKRLTKELYAFDTNHNKFIVFKDENTPNNSYHGYHVDNENEVPKKIRDILRPND